MNRISSTVLLSVSLCAPVSVSGGLSVAFPAERQRLPAVERTYLIGATEPGRTEFLYVNGITTDVYRTGAFLAMVPVTPGTNTVTICMGRDRLVRSFVVDAVDKDVSPRPQPFLSDDDSRLGEPAAWKTVGDLLTNRVRSEPDGGDTLFQLPSGFVMRGAEVKDLSWIAVWLEGRLGFIPKSVVKRHPSMKIPSKGLIAPDPTAGFTGGPPTGRQPQDIRICVDAGHGGADTGALSPHGWREKDVNLMQARALCDALEKAGFQVCMTRTDDSFPSLLDRPRMALRERVDAFISVHHNATPAGKDPREVRHTTTYASNALGLDLARAIQKHMASVLAPIHDAGAQMKSLAVCRNPAIPSCLLEVDFINLPEGEAESWDPGRQARVATAVVCGVLDWITPR